MAILASGKLTICYGSHEKWTIEIDCLQFLNMVIFYSYLQLPEGKGKMMMADDGKPPLVSGELMWVQRLKSSHLVITAHSAAMRGASCETQGNPM
jgi:hypothetical protein